MELAVMVPGNPYVPVPERNILFSLIGISSFLLVIRLTFVFKQGSLMCHLAHRIVRAFLAAKGVIIFQHQCAEVSQLDFHIRMQMPEIESATAYILARATE